ncbi:MAG TPA: class II D-tagatose-bisphosphate aldolase, non-catalytic subunit [Draconibacterium sp.]|nr:class II D-tagatose-bisphosphate aldolase, non-catalytic subunit [Draconibacterium sp.]
MKDAIKIFLDILDENRKGNAKGVYSVCSANSEVLEACIKQAKADGSILLVESTSNQVDQFGGYTGMKPVDFVNFVHTLAQKNNFPKEMVLLGGDHLGPNAWQNLTVKEAMSNAKVLIEEYVKAGYLKIHLDTSMFCSDDVGDRSGPLKDELVAERTAVLCRVAEDTWVKQRQGYPKPIYIIGTEVPVPGGAREEEDDIHPTTAEDAAHTVNTIKESFKNAGLLEAWDRVIGLVVQPGVEFGDDRVFKYQRGKAYPLSKAILEFDHLVYEAHSTDYQTEENLRALVEDHFCILKVGPWLTFAYREALFALEAMEIEILGKDHKNLSNLRNTLETAMLAEPKYWAKYYVGDEQKRLFKRKYSFSDRLRYYWPLPELDQAKNRLFENLRKHCIPFSLLSQFMPVQFYQVNEGLISTDPQELVHSYIQIVSGIYSRACGLSVKNR